MQGLDYLRQIDEIKKAKRVLVLILMINIAVNVIMIIAAAFLYVGVSNNRRVMLLMPLVLKGFVVVFGAMMLVSAIIVSNQKKKIRGIDSSEAKKVVKFSNIVGIVSGLPLLTMILLFAVLGIMGD